MLTLRPRLLFVLPLLSALSGCGLFYKPDETATVSSPPPAATQPTADAADAAALAAKVASYRQSVEAQMQQKDNSAAVASAATQPAASSIDWTSVGQMRLSSYPQETVAPVHAAPAPATPAAPADVQPAAPVASAGGNANFPVSLPEGVERPQGEQAQQASETQSPVWTADQVEHNLAQKLRDDPQDLEGQLNYELMLYLEGQPVPQLSALSGLRDEDRELLAAVMDGLSNLRSVVRGDPNALLATKAKPLIDMADRLRTQSELTLSAPALCSQVMSYGVYTPVDAGWFKAGQENKVIVYCEVENFQSRLSPDNQWQTQLTQDMTLYTDAGMAVWPDKPQPRQVTDHCRQRRHDFFVAELVTLPASLPAGQYLLKISVTDEQTHRVAETTAPLQIAAQ